MASKSQKRCTLQCFRASKNQENSSQSGQNASKSSILHVQFAVTTVDEKASKGTPKWPQKTQKSTPRRLQDGPSAKFKPSKMMFNFNSTSRTPKRPPRGPQEAPKRPPRGLQEAPGRPPRGPKKPRRSLQMTLLNVWKTMSFNVILSNFFTYLISYLTSFSRLI